jgi:hypothetical protein
MRNANLDTDISKISIPAAYLSIVASVAALIFLTGLHLLSPEFDRSWRAVSEYANGQYGWVLSLMFICWEILLVFHLRRMMFNKGRSVGLCSDTSQQGHA